MIFLKQTSISVLSIIMVNLALTIQAQQLPGISVVLGSKQYYIDSVRKGNFYEGVHFCAQYDMTLAAIENDTQMSQLKKLLLINDISGKDYWLGGNNAGMDGTYVWFGKGKPVNTALNMADMCLSGAANTFALAESACATSLNFICERPLEPNCGKYGQCRYTYSYSTN